MFQRVCFATVALVASAGLTVAAPVDIFDGNSRARFDPTAGNQIEWIVDGVSQLFNQRFYYRGVGMNDEVAVDTLFLVGSFASDTNPFVDPRPDTFASLYRDAVRSLDFEFSFKLRGGTPGSGTSDLAETIRITNTGTVATTLSFFQYVDFDLGGTSGGDVGEIVDSRVARQWEQFGVAFISETVVTPAPNFFQIGNWPSIVSLFGNGVPDNLNNSAGPVFGDVTWSFQWNITLLPGQTFIISKDKLIFIPTPGAFAALGLGGLIAARRRR
jgi:hypothetical protein